MGDIIEKLNLNLKHEFFLPWSIFSFIPSSINKCPARISVHLHVCRAALPPPIAHMHLLHKFLMSSYTACQALFSKQSYVLARRGLGLSESEENVKGLFSVLCLPGSAPLPSQACSELWTQSTWSRPRNIHTVTPWSTLPEPGAL